MTRRFLIFGHDNYYPTGGMGDYLTDFTEYNYKTKPIPVDYDCFDIVELETMEFISFELDHKIEDMDNEGQMRMTSMTYTEKKKYVLSYLIEQFVERE
jgi:hypothetical protein